MQFLVEIHENNIETHTCTKEGSLGDKTIVKEEDPSIDWKPQEKCFFCVDGKLLTVNESGDLVAESDPASTESELPNRVTKI